jgi:hypothetical protein
MRQQEITVDPAALATALEQTAVRQQLSLPEAVEYQFELIDAIQRVLGSDDVFRDDYGQERSLGTGPMGGGGRPESTARVERALATFLEVDDVSLVHGAGTGSIRAMLDAGVPRDARVILHVGPPYKTTAAALENLRVPLEPTDFDDADALREALRSPGPGALFIQHVPHRMGDRYELRDVIALAREERGGECPILVDDNYAAMRTPRLGVHEGADASAISLFKLLAPTNVGFVAGTQQIIDRIRSNLASAGSQVQGRDAMEALRSLVYAPVALAIQNQVVEELTVVINELVRRGKLPLVHRAVATQPGMRGCVLVLERPIAPAFLAAAWRNGSPSRSVGEEARYDFLPLITTMPGTFVRHTPILGSSAVRINPLRGGVETIVRILLATVNDLTLRAEVEANCS